MQVAVLPVVLEKLPGVPDAGLTQDRLRSGPFVGPPAVLELNAHGAFDVFRVYQQVEIAHASHAIIAIVPKHQGRALESMNSMPALPNLTASEAISPHRSRFWRQTVRYVLWASSINPLS